jgi:hypothetical protein
LRTRIESAAHAAADTIAQISLLTLKLKLSFCWRRF